MPVHNADVAALFEEVADLLAIEGANEFRVRAYRNAAQTVRQLSRPVADLGTEGEDLTELPDIGDDLAGKIETIVETGTLPLLDELRGRIDPVLVELLDVPGLGPKRVRALHEALDVTSREDLEAAAQEGRIQSWIRGSAGAWERGGNESLPCKTARTGPSFLRCDCPGFGYNDGVPERFQGCRTLTGIDA